VCVLTKRGVATTDPLLDDFLEQIGDLGVNISKCRGSSLEKIDNYYFDWLKAAQHLQERCHEYDQTRLIQAHISQCQAVWAKLGSLLLKNRLESLLVSCSHSRCPWPVPIGGAGFACGRCGTATYCSRECQRS
jgi:hypothetical protein